MNCSSILHTLHLPFSSHKLPIYLSPSISPSFHPSSCRVPDSGDSKGETGSGHLDTSPRTPANHYLTCFVCITAGSWTDTNKQYHYWYQADDFRLNIFSNQLNDAIKELKILYFCVVSVFMPALPKMQQFSQKAAVKIINFKLHTCHLPDIRLSSAPSVWTNFKF